MDLLEVGEHRRGTGIAQDSGRVVKDGASKPAQDAAEAPLECAARVGTQLLASFRANHQQRHLKGASNRLARHGLTSPQSRGRNGNGAALFGGAGMQYMGR